MYIWMDANSCLKKLSRTQPLWRRCSKEPCSISDQGMLFSQKTLPLWYFPLTWTFERLCVLLPVCFSTAEEWRVAIGFQLHLQSSEMLLLDLWTSDQNSALISSALILLGLWCIYETCWLHCICSSASGRPIKKVMRNWPHFLLLKSTGRLLFTFFIVQIFPSSNLERKSGSARIHRAPEKLFEKLSTSCWFQWTRKWCKTISRWNKWWVSLQYVLQNGVKWKKLWLHKIT